MTFHKLESMDTNSMETNICSDTTSQPSICSTSTSVVSQPSPVDQQVMDQFAQMKTILTLFFSVQAGDNQNKPSATTWHLKLKTRRKENFRLLEMRQLNFYVGYTTGQKKDPISHSNLHFLRIPVQLPHMCHKLISSSQQPLP